jgi:hypothetical protein
MFGLDPTLQIFCHLPCPGEMVEFFVHLADFSAGEAQRNIAVNHAEQILQ